MWVAFLLITLFDINIHTSFALPFIGLLLYLTASIPISTSPSFCSYCLYKLWIGFVAW